VSSHILNHLASNLAQTRESQFKTQDFTATLVQVLKSGQKTYQKQVDVLNQKVAEMQRNLQQTLVHRPMNSMAKALEDLGHSLNNLGTQIKRTGNGFSDMGVKLTKVYSPKKKPVGAECRQSDTSTVTTIGSASASGTSPSDAEFTKTETVKEIPAKTGGPTTQTEETVKLDPRTEQISETSKDEASSSTEASLQSLESETEPGVLESSVKSQTQIPIVQESIELSKDFKTTLPTTTSTSISQSVLTDKEPIAKTEVIEITSDTTQPSVELQNPESENELKSEMLLTTLKPDLVSQVTGTNQ